MSVCRSFHNTKSILKLFRYSPIYYKRLRKQIQVFLPESYKYQQTVNINKLAIPGQLMYNNTKYLELSLLSAAVLAVNWMQ